MGFAPCAALECGLACPRSASAPRLTDAPRLANAPPEVAPCAKAAPCALAAAPRPPIPPPPKWPPPPPPPCPPPPPEAPPECPPPALLGAVVAEPPELGPLAAKTGLAAISAAARTTSLVDMAAFLGDVVEPLLLALGSPVKPCERPIFIVVWHLQETLSLIIRPPAVNVSGRLFSALNRSLLPTKIRI